MKHELPPLPYKKKALEPFLSTETLEFHYEKHHRGYVEKLNELIVGTPYEEMALADLIRQAEGKIFNNAAQVWNHTFYWNCMSPDSTQLRSHDFQEIVRHNFGSREELLQEFTEAGKDYFGSGYVWLTLDSNGSLRIETMTNAENPLTQDRIPLLTADLWEHAYYIDYRNERARYLNQFVKKINWEFVERNFQELGSAGVSFRQTKA